MRPGDLFIAPMSGAPARAVVYGGQLLLGEYVRLGPLAVGHIGIVGPDGQLIEAMPNGARKRELRASDWTPHSAFARMSEDYPGQALDAAMVAEAMIGTPYSFGSYVQLAAWRLGWKTWRLEERINRRHAPRPLTFQRGRVMVALPTEAICSVLADQAWSLAGKRVVQGVAKQAVTPGRLALSLWRPSVLWGGAGILG